MSKRYAPKNTYWRGKILWGRIEVKGKEHKWSLRTGDAATAKRRVKAERQRLIAEAHFGEQRHSYETVVAEWAQHIADQIGSETSKRYGVSLAQLEPELLGLFIDEIDKAKIQEIIKRRREQVSTATIRRDLTALSSVLGFAEDQDYREGNPALAALKKLKERRDPIVLPSHEHIARVQRRAPKMFGAMIRAALLTGCRQNELKTAFRSNFDRDRRQLTVRGKGNKTRAIDLCSESLSLLSALPVALGCRFLFWHSDGEPFRSVANQFRVLVANEMKAAQKAAQEKGLKEPDFRTFRFHDLRHRHAVDWLKSGRSIYDLQHRLGHTSIKTTEMYLEFLTPEELRVVKNAPAQIPAQMERFDERKLA